MRSVGVRTAVAVFVGILLIVIAISAGDGALEYVALGVGAIALGAFWRWVQMHS